MHGHHHQCRAPGSGIQRLELRRVLVHAYLFACRFFLVLCSYVREREREREIERERLCKGSCTCLRGLLQLVRQLSECNTFH